MNDIEDRPSPALPESSRRAAAIVFTASLLGLFLELALIRFVTSELRVFAYCKNLVLVACFLGFGVGCFLHRRRTWFEASACSLLLLGMLLRLPWQMLRDYGPQAVSLVLQDSADLAVFRDGRASAIADATAQVAFVVGWTTVVFFALAAILVPYGQLVASGMARLENRIASYSLNVFGSLIGILGFVAATAVGMPPVVWFVPVALATALLASEPRVRLLLLAFCAALLLTHLPDDGEARQDFWTPYQKLTLVDHHEIVVNNLGYQSLFALDVSLLDRGEVNRWVMPYATRRPAGRVLIIGAGAGNDAAVALQAGATAVTAVEIDPTIHQLGRRFHPQQPYSDPRVRVVVDDARHFLKTERDVFDVIVFSHLDAHTLLSGYSTVRLDNYVHTLESFREARARLAPNGILYVGYWCPERFIGERLQQNLTLAFGHAPVALELPYRVGSKPIVEAHFLIGEAGTMAGLHELESRWKDYAPARFATDDVLPSTDLWPFLALRRPEVPPLILFVSITILAVALAFAWAARPAGEPFDGRLFFLGAAFMLVEVHNVSRLALVFGTTWQVNAWVIGAILLVILLANFVHQGVAARLPVLPRIATAGLFFALAIAAFAPLDLSAASLGAGGAFAAVALLTLPIFFAALVFADAFARSPSPGFALAWNVLGSVVGGMLEAVSFVWGLPALLPVAAILYAAAILSGGSRSSPR